MTDHTKAASYGRPTADPRRMTIRDVSITVDASLSGAKQLLLMANAEAGAAHMLREKMADKSRMKQIGGFAALKSAETACRREAGALALRAVREMALALQVALASTSLADDGLAEGLTADEAILVETVLGAVR